MPHTPFRIGILECGRPPEGVTDFGDYPSMIVDWINMPGAETVRFAVLDEEFPKSPEDADVWIISGSRFGAYEDHPWIPPLEEFIRSCRDASVPMIGICFGHQMIAQALGGTVRKSDKGWGVGVHDYAVLDWPDDLGPAPAGIQLQAFHQDQVEECPKDAQVIASSEFCQNAALWYPGFAVSFQGHPEFSNDFARALLQFRFPDPSAANIGADAIETVKNPTNRDDLAAHARGWIERRRAHD